MKKLILICLCLSVLPLSLLAAPESKLWPYWSTYDAHSSKQLNHEAWQRFLTKYIVVSGENNLIRYESVTAQDKQQLTEYIQLLESTNPHELNRNEQMAYWINLYNAVTVNLIIDNYPVESITKLGGVFAFGPWDKELITINKKKLTLNDVEHRILRPIWKDKRIHYAVNCASIGCPNLLDEAFDSKRLTTQLDKAAKQFINSKKGVTISKDGSVTFSKIYHWYAVDFGNYDTLIKHLDTYHVDNISSALKSQKPEYKYNWDLNTQ